MSNKLLTFAHVNSNKQQPIKERRKTMEDIKKELEEIKRTLNEEARICETMLNGNECWTEVDCNIIIDLAKRLNKINL